MTTYLLALSMVVSSVFLFTSKTEQSRVVAIHRPLVITQDRKTPAYYVYQQTQNLQLRSPAAVENEITNTRTTFLSNLSLPQATEKIELAAMTFSRKEALAQLEATYLTASNVINKAINEDTQNLAYEKVFVSQPVATPLSEQASEVPALSPSKKWATIKGKFELKDGVGIVDHYIELKRVEEGQVRELGRIDLTAGAYSIDIESPQGYLIAQIKDRTGFLIGEDRQKLINLQSRGNYFEGPFIRVGNPETIAANLADPKRDVASKTGASSFASKTTTAKSNAVTSSSISVSLFDNQTTLSKASDVFSNVSRYSSTISRIFDPSRIYKNITSIRHTGEKTETPVFTSKWLAGVTQYISDAQKIEFKDKNIPVIIGRVLSNGKSIADAQVQIESVPGVTAIYFDQFMIPSFALQGTSENGYFMFIGVEPAAYTIVATKLDIVFGSQMFIAEEDAIAFQNINSVSIPRTKVIRSFDAFTSEPVTADVVFAESEEAVETDGGTAVIKTLTELGVAEFVVRTNDRKYLPIRNVQNARQEYVHIPLIQQSWLAAIKNAKAIPELANTGIIIGFTTDLVYDAYLATDSYDKNNIVYFDHYGQLTSAPTQGGGFILYNVPVGAREVILQEKSLDKIYSQVVNVVNQQISVSHFLAD
ncbi:MAG: hypothetical protein ABL930_02145 [Pseudobdellovibrio sp.]